MTKEQIAQSAAEKIGDPPLSQMMRTVMNYVAALAKASQVAKPIIGWVMVKMRRGEKNSRCLHAGKLFQIRPAGAAPPPVAPGLPFLIVPPSVRKTPHRCPMRPAAALADPSGALKTHPPAEFPPMRGIKAAKIRANGHKCRM